MIHPKDTQYLFIDMNAFFASCEQETHFEFRHRPMAVTPVDAPTGCIISPSYEAKSFGIKTGMLVREAKKICPQIIIRESAVTLYLKFHQKLVKILYSFSPFVIIKSVDEAVVKLSPSEQNSLEALSLAKAIKEQITAKLGRYMRASIGIGPNVWLAKMAAESQKPDGLVELKLKNLPQFYQKLKLIDLKGINFRMARQLNHQGVFTPTDLYLISRENLRCQLGIIGDYWYLRLHGYDIDIFASQTKTIGHSHILEPKMRQWPSAWAVCQKLAEKAGRRLRKEKLSAGGVHLWIRYLRVSAWHQGVKTCRFSDSQTLVKFIGKLWDKAPKESLPLGIGLSLYNLTQSCQSQGKLFPEMQKIDHLYRAIDKINDQYGSFTIKPANILSVGSSAPHRIAFGRPIYH